MTNTTDLRDKKDKKVQKRTIESRERLLSAAYQLFSEKGYYYTNTKEIVKLAGISIGNFYNYYKDKADIYLDLAKQYLDGSCKGIRTITEVVKPLGREEAKAKLIEYIYNQLGRAEGANRFFDDADIIAKDNGELTNSIHLAEEQAIALLTDLLEHQIKEKKLQEESATLIKIKARMLYVTTNEVSNDIIRVPAGKERDEYIELLAEFITNMTYD